MEYNKNRIRYYTVRLELTEDLRRVWKDFISYIKIFEEQEKVKFEIDFWYDANKINKIEFVENAGKYFPKKYTMFDIRFHTTTETDEMTSKYYFNYIDSNSFVSCIFEIFSFIKAILNHEDSKNENRNDRKQTIYKKTRDKRFSMDDKKQFRKR